MFQIIFIVLKITSVFRDTYFTGHGLNRQKQYTRGDFIHDSGFLAWGYCWKVTVTVYHYTCTAVTLSREEWTFIAITTDLPSRQVIMRENSNFEDFLPYKFIVKKDYLPHWEIERLAGLYNRNKYPALRTQTITCPLASSVIWSRALSCPQIRFPRSCSTWLIEKKSAYIKWENSK